MTGVASKTISATEKSAECTLSPLIYGEDEGDNTGLPSITNATMLGIAIPTLSMKGNSTHTRDSCLLHSINIEDDEGDDSKDVIISIPTIWSKSDISSSTKHLSAPTLIRSRTSKQLLAPTLVHSSATKR